MSLFIGNLAFAESPLLVDEVKVGGTCRLCTGSTGGYADTALFSFASFPVSIRPENPRDDGDFYFLQTYWGPLGIRKLSYVKLFKLNG
jgi:hypothetical protein